MATITMKYVQHVDVLNVDVSQPGGDKTPTYGGWHEWKDRTCIGLYQHRDRSIQLMVCGRWELSERYPAGVIPPGTSLEGAIDLIAETEGLVQIKLDGDVLWEPLAPEEEEGDEEIGEQYLDEDGCVHDGPATEAPEEEDEIEEWPPF